MSENKKKFKVLLVLVAICIFFAIIALVIGSVSLMKHNRATTIERYTNATATTSTSLTTQARMTNASYATTKQGYLTFELKDQLKEPQAFIFK